METKQTNITTTPRITHDIALTIDSLEYLLWKEETFLPVKYETIARTMMYKVVVFTPPAVDSGEPPMNINKQLATLPTVEILSWL